MWSFSKEDNLYSLSNMYPDRSNLNNVVPYYFEFTSNGILYNDATYNYLSSNPQTK